MKKCFKCGIKKELTSFYKHKKMSDGYLGKCKMCTKKDVHLHRAKNIEKIRDYDRNRPNKIKRYAENKVRQSGEYKVFLAMQKANWAKINPIKVNAERTAYNAIKRGLLIKQPCEKCGLKKVHAHHDNYSKPLNVRWLCASHHSEFHRLQRHFERIF